MSSSISGTATAQPPVSFSLEVYGVAARRLDKELAPKPSDELARQREAKRKVQHDIEMLALEWAKTMLEKTIYAALDPATDPALAAKLREQVLNRSIGRVKTQEDDEDAKKQKGLGVEQFLEALAAASAVQGAIERTPPAQRVERDVTPSSTDGDLQQLLDDLNEGEDDE